MLSRSFMLKDNGLSYRWIWPDKIRSMPVAERQTLIQGLNDFASRMLKNHPDLFPFAMRAWASHAFVDAVLRENLSPFVVCLSSGKVVGAVKYNITNVKKQWVGEVGLEIVDPAFQRKGIATGLVHRLIAFSRKNNILTIHVQAKTDANKLRYLKWHLKGGKPYFVDGKKRLTLDSIFFGNMGGGYNVKINVTPTQHTKNLRLRSKRGKGKKG